MNQLRVLIIEDSEDSALLMQRELHKAGYIPVCLRVQTEETMRTALQEETWDLILSDHDMPNFSAPEALAVFQESCLNIPFIIVSGAIGEEVAVAAMKAGAHDFIIKQNIARLIPAVQRELGDAENRRERLKAEEESRERYKEIQILSGRILHAYEEERSRLARELHDEIGQALTVVNLDLQYLQMKLSSSERSLQEKIASSLQLLEQTLDYVRRQIMALRPPSLDNMGLVEVVRDMALELGNRADMAIEINENGFDRRLPADIETALYRCIQEALTNTVRHAAASKVDIELLKEPRVVSVAIEDNGKGFDPVSNNVYAKGVGLAGIRERVTLLGGKLQIDAAPGKGVRIAITIPLPVDAEKGGITV
jgi:signal transduction histidine kinase